MALLDNCKTNSRMSRVTYWDHIYLSIWFWNVPPVLKAVHLLIQEAIRHEWWHVWTMWYCTFFPFFPIPLKGWVSVQGHWGVTSGSTVTLSWEINEARAQKGSLRTVHICTNQHCFVTTIFSQLCQMRSEAQMCHILRTYAGSSHTNNQRRPKGQVTLAMLHKSRKIFLKIGRIMSCNVLIKKKQKSSQLLYHD